ncbi:MAG: hypothetical protein ACYC8T_24965 [Myxococcaceae bacterium]
MFFRAMLSLDDHLPTVGEQRNMLGVRPGTDIKTTMAGPGRGGMSVTAKDPKAMTPGVLPRAFGGLNGETVMFQTELRTFGAESGLAVGPVHPKKLHAVVEAAAECTLDIFQSLLAATRPSWSATALPNPGGPR